MKKLVWLLGPVFLFALMAGCDNEVDTVNPVVAIVAPADGSTHAAGIITIKAVATDNQGVTRVEFYKGRSKLGESTTGTADTFTFGWDASTEEDSSLHDLYATAFDAAGNSSQASVTVAITATGVRLWTGTLTQNVTVRDGDTVVLRGGVFVGDDINETVLTIEPGATILGEASTKGMLVVRRNSKIHAVGTAEKPIVMTSEKAPGQRSRGDWGGVIINGRAPLNTGEEAYGEGGTGYYGGNVPGDNSGRMSYVRIEFAGREISPDNELNGLALQGVGSGTQIDHIQIHMNKDDGIEFFGGTVNAKYILITGAADDQFDYTDGWQGKAQFIVCQQYPDDSDNGFECDNNGEDHASSPASNPQVYNFTIIGADTSARSDDGMLLRAGTKGRFYNGLVMGMNDCGLDIDDSVTWANASSGQLKLENSLFFNSKNFKEDADTLRGWFVRDFALTWNSNNATASSAVVVSPFSIDSPDFRPTGQALSHPVATPPNDGFFTPVSFIGGVDPNDNWTAGWTTRARN